MEKLKRAAYETGLNVLCFVAGAYLGGTLKNIPQGEQVLRTLSEANAQAILWSVVFVTDVYRTFGGKSLDRWPGVVSGAVSTLACVSIGMGLSYHG